MAFVYIYPPQSVSVATPPVQFELDGVDTTVSRDTVTPANSTPLPVINLDATGNPVTPLTDTELRATPVPVSGPLTDAELRATPVPVSGPLTDAELRANPVVVDTGLNQPLTDTELRASPVVVDTGLTQPLTDTELRASPVPVSGPLTDAELRASAVPVSAASLPLPSGASTLAEQQAQSTLIGPINETAPATDTDPSGLNGRLQRIAQRLTSLIALLPTSLGQKASSASLATVLSTEQEALLTAIRDGVRASTPNGSTQSNSTVGTTADNVAIPANTVGFLIQGFTGNAGLYWSLGGTAANDGTSGHKLEDSRDSGFIPYAGTGNLSVIGEAASTRYQITWFTRS